MPRRPSIWKRDGRDDWYTTIAGRQINLGPDRETAEREFHRLRARPTQAKNSLLVRELVDQYLDWARDQVKPVTWTTYNWYLERWNGYAGRLRARELKPLHVTAWLKLWPGWGPSTRHVAISVVRIWSGWCKNQGHLDTNPLAGTPKPQMQRRKPAAKGNLERFMMAVNSEPFREIFEFMIDAGCRPGEARTLEASRIDWEASTAVVTGKLGERVISLTARSLDVLRRLAVVNPEGPIFRNARGNGWAVSGLEAQFRRTSDRANLAVNFSAYQTRHAFWGRAHRAGVDSIVVAKQMGHVNLDMLARHYADVDPELTKAAVEKTAAHFPRLATSTDDQPVPPDSGMTPGKPARPPRPKRSDGRTG